MKIGRDDSLHLLLRLLFPRVHQSQTGLQHIQEMHSHQEPAEGMQSGFPLQAVGEDGQRLSMGDAPKSSRPVARRALADRASPSNGHRRRAQFAANSCVTLLVGVFHNDFLCKAARLDFMNVLHRRNFSPPAPLF